MRGIIYCYTSPNGKCYIGQTVDENKRKYQHKCCAYNKDGKYGWDKFSYEVLWEKELEEVEMLLAILNKQEIFYIELFDSFYNGYNCTKGGTYVDISSNVGHELSQ